MPTVHKKTSSDASTSIWTIGHSTRSADELNEILLAHRIGVLVDVRSFPGSRRYPHFNKLELGCALDAIGIQYAHSPQLGGRRRPNPQSKNTAWQNASFRAYADHMESEEFQKGIQCLLELAGETRTAVMCAEALWVAVSPKPTGRFLESGGLRSGSYSRFKTCGGASLYNGCPHS